MKMGVLLLLAHLRTISMHTIVLGLHMLYQRKVSPARSALYLISLFCVNIVVNIASHLYANLLYMSIIVLQIFLNHVPLIVFTVMCLVQ